MNNSWLSLLGLVARARKLMSGEELVLKEVRRNGVKLVLLAADASEGTKKKIHDKCEFYNVPLRMVADRYELGASIGKGERVVIGVIDAGFAKKLISLLDQ